MRIAILWKQLSGYAMASFRALAAEGVEVFLVHPSAKAEAPFDDRQMEHDFPGFYWVDSPDERRLRAEVAAFGPDALLVSSWDVSGYRHVSRSMNGRALRVLCMDNQWLGTAKQWAGRLVSPGLIRPAYDVAFVPAERQAAFARRLGFADDRLLWGLYTCDHDAFSRVAGDSDARTLSPRFLFAGRLAPEKGVDVLATAYQRYREMTESPWPMTICGTGPLASTLSLIPGVETLGFVQPGDLPTVFSRATCLVLPSTFEPWGVVVHEATAAGLSVICTSACGASTRLVLDGYNGALIAPGDAGGLAGAMARIAGADAESTAEMGRRSVELARQFTPQRWARYLVERLPQLQAGFETRRAEP
ncbi:MAG TPA: glycosyltransferase family 4 protein [Acidimicrobiales bacterium]|nr:glycosyltransferase family 4 protein [Acidimicrobiales bacterium]